MKTRWWPRGLVYPNQTAKDAQAVSTTHRKICSTHLVLDELQISQLIHQQRFITSMEERGSLHPFQTMGDSVVVHQQSSEEETGRGTGSEYANRTGDDKLTCRA